MKKTGRPDLYTDKLAREICQAISNSSKGLNRLCKENKHWPKPATIKSWLWSDKHKEFIAMYARAKDEQADFMAEEIIDIADDGSNDMIITPFGTTENKEVTSRSRLRVDARKFLAAKLKPKKYGDKLDLTSDGEKIVQPVITAMVDGKVIDGKIEQK